VSIGERIREVRKRKKITLAILGKSLGISLGAISAWEVGRNIPNGDMMGKLAVTLDVPVNWLMDTSSSGEYTISKEVYGLAKAIDSLPEEDRQTVINVLNAIKKK